MLKKSSSHSSPSTPNGFPSSELQALLLASYNETAQGPGSRTPRTLDKKNQSWCHPSIPVYFFREYTPSYPHSVPGIISISEYLGNSVS